MYLFIKLLLGKTCFKINPCLIENGGCSHGCQNNHGEVQCLCPPGYKLFSKQCLDEDPCQKHNGGCSHFCSNVDGNIDKQTKVDKKIMFSRQKGVQLPFGLHLTP